MKSGNPNQDSIQQIVHYLEAMNLKRNYSVKVVPWGQFLLNYQDNTYKCIYYS